MPEKLLPGNAVAICAILASESGRIAGPPSPPKETLAVDVDLRTPVSSGSIGGSVT